MNFITFNDFLNCVYVPPNEANQRPSPDEVLEGLMAIYSGETPDMTPNENIARKTVQGLKVIGTGVVKIVHRCKDARESEMLDLNSCTLLHIPEGVLHLMKHYNVSKCNLSNNLLSKLSPRFGSCFTNITSLDLSTNNLSSLPKDIVQCRKVETVNVSKNSFVVFPYILLEIKQLSEINISSNFIAEIDDEAVEIHQNLQELNVEGNPLTNDCHEKFSCIQKPNIKLSNKVFEEWEDLSI